MMRPSPARNRTSRSHQGIFRLVLGLFLLRALIPVGFMPAALESGGPIMICHSGLAGAFFEALAAHQASTSTPSEASTPAAAPTQASGHPAELHHGHPAESGGQPDASHDGWEHCSFGTAAGSAALVPDLAIHLLTLDHTFADTQPADTDRVAPFSSYQARAPPLPVTRILL